MSRTKVPTWVWIIVGVVTLGILGVITLAAAGLWFVRSHVNVQPTTVAAATTDFQTIRERFANQKPLIELDDHGNFVHANTDRPNGTKRPESLNVMAFDAREEHLVRVEVPFWMLRLKTRGTLVDVGSGNIDLQKLRLTVEDLERFGPTLIVDHKDMNGSRVLVWSQ
ncbi:MAG TPA: hypothetical protein VH138_04510 [Vicinamibacterales bacterium]|jgi:hypothetical protein|nr:hypothetical protein [Vicinamibacterales bacterium]